MDIQKILEILKQLSPLYSASYFVYKSFYQNEKDANEAYRRLTPAVKSLIKSYGRTSDEATAALLALAELAPIGAKKRNFKIKYIKNPDGWKLLPKEPNDIPYAHWH